MALGDEGRRPAMVYIAGFLGSGKTTTIIKVGKEMSERMGLRVAIIVNDFGEMGIDGKVIEDYGFEVMEMASGCICCTLATDLFYVVDMIRSSFRPDVFLVEPSGVATLSNIRKAAERQCERRGIRMGPLVTIVDAARADLILDEERPLFMADQIKAADIVAINKVDAAPPDDVDRLEEEVRRLQPNAAVVRISAKLGEGVDKLIEAVANWGSSNG